LLRGDRNRLRGLAIGTGGEYFLVVWKRENDVTPGIPKTVEFSIPERRVAKRIQGGELHKFFLCLYGSFSVFQAREKKDFL